jgi:hypothetical protein
MNNSSKAEYYRTKSEEAERNSAAAKNPTAKKLFATVAQHWREMARDTEHRESSAETNWLLYPIVTVIGI